ncbi:MAG: HAD-IA family hydrolase [Verrucomicrobia bacterium]|jgi:HAD superfamily hydrolase (TIGR01509 family)|nr:HAD-IA family hydrolase [Verrucomicrobiota bacterium]
MSPGPDIRAVIFDMDGVLCESEPFIAEAACRMFAETHGVRVTPEDFRPYVGTGEDRFLGGVAEKFGVTLTLPRDKQRTYDIYLETIRGRMQPVRGVKEFIAECRRRGMKLAVATSADRVKMTGNLREIGLPPETFDACVTGDDIQRKKPDPQIFQLAASRLAVSPAHCLVVEDAISGVQAARAAGAKCLALTTSFDAAALQNTGADWTARNFADERVLNLFA